MKLFLLFTFALNHLCQSKYNEYFHRAEFVKFQERFSKHYSNVQEMETRFSIFKTNLIQIISHNADRSQNFTMGVNQFTDLTPQEFKSQYVRGENSMINLYG